jgi:hypothetical protein
MSSDSEDYDDYEREREEEMEKDELLNEEKELSGLSELYEIQGSQVPQKTNTYEKDDLVAELRAAKEKYRQQTCDDDDHSGEYYCEYEIERRAIMEEWMRKEENLKEEKRLIDLCEKLRPLVIQCDFCFKPLTIRGKPNGQIIWNRIYLFSPSKTKSFQYYFDKRCLEYEICEIAYTHDLQNTHMCEKCKSNLSDKTFQIEKKKDERFEKMRQRKMVTDVTFSFLTLGFKRKPEE